MKMIMKILAVILICAMLAACGSNSTPQEIVSASTDSPAPTASLDSALTDTTVEETEAPTEEPIPFVVEIKPVITETQNQVTVSTVDE